MKTMPVTGLRMKNPEVEHVVWGHVGCDGCCAGVAHALFSNSRVGVAEKWCCPKIDENSTRILAIGWFLFDEGSNCVEYFVSF
jgi:hypothetical protein